jgi:hypothetical protein
MQNWGTFLDRIGFKLCWYLHLDAKKPSQKIINAVCLELWIGLMLDFQKTQQKRFSAVCGAGGEKTDERDKIADKFMDKLDIFRPVHCVVFPLIRGVARRVCAQQLKVLNRSVSTAKILGMVPRFSWLRPCSWCGFS